jgi:hypothetical protein
VVIRQARQSEQEAHDNLFAETTRIWNDNSTGGEMRIMQRVSVGEVQRTEAFLTLVESNLVHENSQPVFRFGPLATGRSGLIMDSNAFAAAWGALPHEVAAEIHEKVRLVNPQWGPEGKAG